VSVDPEGGPAGSNALGTTQRLDTGVNMCNKCTSCVEQIVACDGVYNVFTLRGIVFSHPDVNAFFIENDLVMSRSFLGDDVASPESQIAYQSFVDALDDATLKALVTTLNTVWGHLFQVARKDIPETAFRMNFISFKQQVYSSFKPVIVDVEETMRFTLEEALVAAQKQFSGGSGYDRIHNAQFKEVTTPELAVAADELIWKVVSIFRKFKDSLVDNSSAK
jgi:hypothetical protein